MTRTQMCAFAGLLLVAMTLMVLVGVFAERKAVLAAEGSDLRSAESVWVSASLQELQAHAEEFDQGTRTLKVVDDTTHAVAFLTGGWDDVPLHSGSPLSGSAGEALAGADREPEGDALVAVGKTYRIVGRLGVRPGSLLAADAVIADPFVFDADRERLRLDGPRIVDRFRSAFPGRPFELVDSGVNRRTNVDVVTPVLTTAALVTALLVTVSAATYASHREARAARVRFAVGHRRRVLVAMIALRLAFISLCSSVVALVIGRAVAASLFVRPELVAGQAAVACLAVSIAVLTVIGGVRRWS